MIYIVELFKWPNKKGKNLLFSSELSDALQPDRSWKLGRAN